MQRQTERLDTGLKRQYRQENAHEFVGEAAWLALKDRQIGGGCHEAGSKALVQRLERGAALQLQPASTLANPQ
jgi:hypothetical protein